MNDEFFAGRKRRTTKKRSTKKRSTKKGGSYPSINSLVSHVIDGSGRRKRKSKKTSRKVSKAGTKRRTTKKAGTKRRRTTKKVAGTKRRRTTKKVAGTRKRRTTKRCAGSESNMVMGNGRKGGSIFSDILSGIKDVITTVAPLAPIIAQAVGGRKSKSTKTKNDIKKMLKSMESSIKKMKK